MTCRSRPVPADSATRTVLPMRDAALMPALEDVEQRLEALLESGPRTLVIDMSHVVRLSSTSVAALLWVRRRCSARGVDVVVIAPSRHHMDLLRRIGLRGAPVAEPLHVWVLSSWIGRFARRGVS